ncbi:hypothetical protein Cylst_6180 [Cylindrospermum stagnale PCC 7417]|uniref:Uncharacterized protein n=1 Tax=Cylindrospermum stagnale PCC 7417 TaxID=56107 RepID=K9X7U8_9NOST|nr:hypothetical protein [Cylindrospermum stagnale]AFZ28146.1 hypothetical protein Cylst_6180 [Cylindrospermum stagnale PCC 7417]
MSTDSNSSPTTADDQNIPHTGKFFIPRSQRRRFLIQFTFITVLGWVTGGIASIALETIILASLSPPDSAQSAMLIGYLSNILFAVIFAANQALILRRYLSGWLWLLATSIGWLIANSISTAWINYISSIAASLNESLSPQANVIFGFLSTTSYILAGIWLGICQWLVLRRYTASAWRWNFLPSISFCCISLVIWSLSLVQGVIPESNRPPILYGIEQGLTAVILGIIPAIGLCTLKKNSPRKTELSSSS